MFKCRNSSGARLSNVSESIAKGKEIAKVGNEWRADQIINSL